MKKVMLTTLVLALVMLGCSKEEKEEIIEPIPIVNNNVPTEKHMPLAVGNYWIYETINIDTLGNETTLTGIDSAYIDRDTLINGNTYYMISGGPAINHIMGSTIRNKGNDIVNYKSQGIDKVLFSSSNLGDIYHSKTFDTGQFTITTVTKTNVSKVVKVVNSGVFDCYEGVSTLTQIIPANSNWTKTEKRYYEKSVGIIAGQYTYHYSSNVLELRLLRYHLN